MAIKLSTIIYGAIGLLIMFLLASTLIMPYFRETYEHGFGTAPCQRDSTGCTSGKTNLVNNYCTGATSTVIACASCNVTAGLGTFLDNCYSLISAINGTHCYQCTNFGFKSTSTGLLLLVFVLAIISFAFYFFKIRR